MKDVAIQTLTSVTKTVTRKLARTSPFAASRAVSAGTIRRGFSGQASNGEQYVIKSAYPDTPRPKGNLAEYVLERGRKFTHNVALVDGLTDRAVTYGELIDSVYRWGAMVERHRTASGRVPTVALFMNNSPDYAPIFLGTILVGGISTTISSSFTASEVVYQLVDSGADILVVDSDTEKVALKALHKMRQQPGISTIPKLFVCGPSTSGESDLRTLLLDKTAPMATPYKVEDDLVSVLPYSSGTTGRPKGVRVRTSSLLANIAMYNNDYFSMYLNDDKQDSVLSLIPFSHIYGIMCFSCLSLTRAMKLITLPGFTQESFVKTIKNWKPIIMPIVPPLLKFLVEYPGITSEDLKSTRQVVIGAAPVPKTSAMKLQEKVGRDLKFQEGYGMTETLATHCTPIMDAKLGYCGQILSHTEAKIVDAETGQILPPGKKGELYIRGPSLMEGYHNNEAATRETIDEEGWLHTGDLAIYHENGFFSIVDRLKELIKVKGLQVSPSELEDVILKIPGVADVGVVGVPHHRYGEAATAYIIKSQSGSVTENTIHSHMKEHLTSYKHLHGGIHFVNELPKNPSGKLLRRNLKEVALKDIAQQ